MNLIDFLRNEFSKIFRRPFYDDIIYRYPFLWSSEIVKIWAEDPGFVCDILKLFVRKNFFRKLLKLKKIHADFPSA